MRFTVLQLLQELLINFYFSPLMADSALNMGTEWRESDIGKDEEVWTPDAESYLCPMNSNDGDLMIENMLQLKCYQ